MNDYGAQSQAPVREGEEVDVLVEAVGGKGDGIAKVKGFVLFVANAKKGDEIRVRITKVLKNVGFAERIGEAQVKREETYPQSSPKKEKPQDIVVDESTGVEKIHGEAFDVEYDPSKDSDDF